MPRSASEGRVIEKAVAGKFIMSPMFRCLQLQDVPTPRIQGSEVLVRVKLRPVNPADISLIQGRMGRPALPLIPGTEGMAIHATPRLAMTVSAMSC